MFTGIIEEVGAVREAERGRLVIACREVLEGTALGDSIAVNGVDLTVAHMEGETLHFNCMPETYRRSNLGGLKPGDAVNLERSVRPTDRLSGHIVRGGTEGTGTRPRSLARRSAWIESIEDHRRARRGAGSPLATVEEAIEEFRQGRSVIIVDDEEREDQGDLCITGP